MTAGLLIISGILLLGALGVLAGAILPLVAELKKSVAIGSERVARLREAVAALREDGEGVRSGVTQLTGALGEWPRAARLPAEAGLLVRQVRALGVATALLSTLRKGAWRGAAKLVVGR